MNKFIWDRLGLLEKEVYKHINPDWLNSIRDNYTYSYEMDEKTIKDLFRYKRVGLELENGEVNTRRNITLDLINNLLDSDGHIRVKFNKSYGDFKSYLMKLSSLEGSPDICEKNYSIYYSSIKDLIGSPRIVKGGYYIIDCTKLQSLEGLPQEVDGDLVIELYNIEVSKEYIESCCRVGGKIIVRKV